MSILSDVLPDVGAKKQVRHDGGCTALHLTGWLGREHVVLLLVNRTKREYRD